MQLFLPRMASHSESDAWTMSMLHDCLELLTAEDLDVFHISDEVRASTLLTEYDRCFAEFDNRLAATESLTVWVFLDDPPKRSVLANHDYEAILQLLILTFPDIRWVALPTYIPKAVETGAFCTALLAGLVAHHLREETLLDCHGLQSAIRKTMEGAADLQARCSLLQRSSLAVAIDEEESYAYFNAYAAYRFGRRAAIVNTEALLEARLRRITNGFRPSLVIEDLYLSFPDRGAATGWNHEKLHMSTLASRDDYFQVMKTAHTRVFVTGGHSQLDGGIKGNEIYLRRLDIPERRIVGLYKPLSGLFRFWWEAVEHEPPSQFWDPRPGFLPDWMVSFMQRFGRRRNSWSESKPPEAAPSLLHTGDVEERHSAPGRLLLVATRLIARAESLLSQVTSVRVAVRGAVLSTQASELLAGRTPTTAFEALSLKHAFEVLAECQFQGVEGVINMNDRFEEICNKATEIGRWFGPERGKQSVLNARLKIASRLALILRERNQFDEEQRCLAETRDLYQRLWFARRPRFIKVLRPFVLYVNWLLSSVPIFAGCIVGWIFILALLYHLVGHGPSVCTGPPAGCADVSNYFAAGGLHWRKALGTAFETFLGLQKSGDFLGWVDVLAMVLGFVHLGVFISHLYSNSARR